MKTLRFNKWFFDENQIHLNRFINRQTTCFLRCSYRQTTTQWTCCHIVYNIDKWHIETIFVRMRTEILTLQIRLDTERRSFYNSLFAFYNRLEEILLCRLLIPSGSNRMLLLPIRQKTCFVCFKQVLSILFPMKQNLSTLLTHQISHYQMPDVLENAQGSHFSRTITDYHRWTIRKDCQISE